MKKIAIIQSCYIPWKGYFDIINSVDEFILYDDTQYTRRDWRNRNIIKTHDGLQWLTIPVEVKGKYLQKINETRVFDKSWAKKHWAALMTNYAKSKFFSQYGDELKAVYHECENEQYLSQINLKFLQLICRWLQIRTPLSWSTDYKIDCDLKKTERLVALCKATGANSYLSGPSAKEYILPDVFSDSAIELTYADYAGYPAYNQLFGEFVHGVSVLDLIFNEGDNARHFMKSFK